VVIGYGKNLQNIIKDGVSTSFILLTNTTCAEVPLFKIRVQYSTKISAILQCHGNEDNTEIMLVPAPVH
jgi:hypothetical protein